MSLKMVEIQEAVCIGCGKCADDCVANNILIEAGKAHIQKICFCCGHCVAICPTAAVSIPSYDMDDVEDITPETSHLDAQTLMRAIKARRSIRDYKPALVESDKINAICEAGRYTATAKNTQGCRFIVVQHDLDDLKQHVWTGISDLLA
ncbi:MAG: nitroreductase family protein, partial [Raoultibacter sp.]